MDPILLVDDDPHIRLCLRDLLEHYGYPCIEAIHGTDALAKLRAETVSLIITDIHMPVMTGLELLEALQSNESSEHIPRFILTGDLTEEIQAQAVQLGVTKVFPKPYELAKIIQAVHEVLGSPSQEGPLN
ncbi:MAG: hypothetical protein NPIRA05_22090 [Nitrospirales bacterium]|nr:MAG: hypothetical protein NPIRA05_22090 [Nitrospirales bacterium]